MLSSTVGIKIPTSPLDIARFNLSTIASCGFPLRKGAEISHIVEAEDELKIREEEIDAKV